MRHLLPASAVALACVMGLAATPAQAEEQVPDPKGFYATLGLGASWPQNVTGNFSVLGVPVNGSYSLGGGFAGEIGVGYDFGLVRSEVTYTYNNANINTGTLSALGLTGSAAISNGNVNTNWVLASAYIDIPTKSPWVPYVGAGLATPMWAGVPTAPRS